ncbi:MULTISPECIES: hypothetical protein [unclassified Arthrobacter]|nr:MULTISPECIES: hypothetical protein [unclassified Arthrobacter]
MRKRPEDMRFFKTVTARKERTLFNDKLLDQRREDVYVALHQLGLIR